MKPLVSILIPAYNAEDTVAATIESALAQTWPRTEIIVVDDGSTDRTVEAANRFAGYGVRILEKENGGAAETRNVCYEQSEGDFIQWLDADDLLSPEKISKQLEILSRPGNERMVASSAWGRFRSRPRRAQFNSTALWADLAPVDWLVRKMGENLYMQTATWLTPRGLCEDAGPWNPDMLSDDDGEYFLRIIAASDGIRFSEEGKVYYRIMPTSRLSYIGNSDRKKEAMLGSIKLHIRKLREMEDSDRVRQSCLNYLHNWLIYFHPERDDLVAQMKSLALEAGGELSEPRLRGKFAWMAPVIGWEAAKQAQFLLPNFKEAILSSWDRALFEVEKGQNQKYAPVVAPQQS